MAVGSVVVVGFAVVGLAIVVAGSTSVALGGGAILADVVGITSIAGANGILAALSRANVPAGSALVAVIVGTTSIAGANGTLVDELTKAESDTYPQHNK